MRKSMKKRMIYNFEVVKALSKEYGVSTTFVRQAIRKEKHSLTAQTIEKKYKELTAPSNKAVQEFISNPTK